MDELLAPCTRKSAESSLTGTQKSRSKALDAKIASISYENVIACYMMPFFYASVDVQITWQKEARRMLHT